MEINMGEPAQVCSVDELEELRDQQFRETDAAAYREEVQKENMVVFESEAKERQEMRAQAKLILSMMKEGNGGMLRQMVSWMHDFPDEEIINRSHQRENLANSPHPLEGFWDMLGRTKQKTA